MNILVTGGLGFIGSHTVIELIKNNHEVIIADNLINSKIEVLDKLSSITCPLQKLHPEHNITTLWNIQLLAG